MAYLVDANVLIEAKNKHYGFSFCPGFWDWIISANLSGKVYVVHPVMAELKKGKDQLKNWCSMNGALCLSNAPNLSSNLKTVANWAYEQTYTQAAVTEFLGVADFQLIGFAMSGNHIIVTHETPGLSKNRIKIPDPCRALGVTYVSPYKMLQSEGAKLVL